MKKRILVLLVMAAMALGKCDPLYGDVLDHWTTNQISTNSYGLSHVVYGNGIYVAYGEFGDYGGYYTSTDGFHWAFQYLQVDSWGANLTFSQGHFGGVANPVGVANVSANGTNWTTTYFMNSAPYFNPEAVTYGNSLYVVVGDTNGVASVATSADGISWTYRSPGTSPGGTIVGVACGGVRFAAIGNNDGNIYTSTLGTIWAHHSIAGGSQISYANGLFFVPLNSKTNLLSSDGVNWNAYATGLTNQLGAVTYANGVFMAQCGISLGGSYLATSSNGTNWYQYSRKLPGTALEFDVNVATDGSRLVVVGAQSPNPNFPIYPDAYCGVAITSGVLVDICMTNGRVGNVALSGLVGRNYQIQSLDSLGGGGAWQTLTSFQLANTPVTWADVTATNASRFYRGVLLP